MTRLWLPMGRRVLLRVAILVFAVLLLPLRMAIGALGIGEPVGARGVHGSVWAGRIDDLIIAGTSLGAVNASLSPVQLLVGRARIDLSRRGGGDPLRGAISVSRNSVGVDDLTGVLPLAGAFAPLPLAALETSDLSVRFSGGACVRAQGSVTARLSGTIAGIALGQGMTGTAVCDGRWLRLPLLSQSRQERLDLRIGASGAFQVDLIAVAPAPDRIAALSAAGFSAIPGGYRLRVSGTL